MKGSTESFGWGYPGSRVSQSSDIAAALLEEVERLRRDVARLDELERVRHDGWIIRGGQSTVTVGVTVYGSFREAADRVATDYPSVSGETK